MQDSLTKGASKGTYALAAKFPGDAVLVTPRGVEGSKEGFEHWSGYDLAFDEYLAVGEASCVVVINETPDMQGFVSADMARLIMCAMYKKKPIVLLHHLGFADDVDEQTVRLIQDRSHKLYMHDLTRLDDQDVSYFLQEVSNKTIDYALEAEDKNFIEESVQSHLYELRAAMATA